MRKLILPAFCLIVTRLAGPLVFGENAVLYWNDQVIDSTRLARNPPPIASQHIATFHAAIFDAVNGITRTHHGWLVNEPAPAGADQFAAQAPVLVRVLAELAALTAGGRDIERMLGSAVALLRESLGYDIVAAYDEARRHRAEVIVERFASGSQYRVTVVGGRVAAGHGAGRSIGSCSQDGQRHDQQRDIFCDATV